jgi:hypothetical protein
MVDVNEMLDQAAAEDQVQILSQEEIEYEEYCKYLDEQADYHEWVVSMEMTRDNSEGPSMFMFD